MPVFAGWAAPQVKMVEEAGVSQTPPDDRRLAVIASLTPNGSLKLRLSSYNMIVEYDKHVYGKKRNTRDWVPSHLRHIGENQTAIPFRDLIRAPATRDLLQENDLGSEEAFRRQVARLSHLPVAGRFPSRWLGTYFQ